MASSTRRLANMNKMIGSVEDMPEVRSRGGLCPVFDRGCGARAV
jgi:hypothetical protein